MCPCSSVYGSYLSIVEIIITVNAVSCFYKLQVYCTRYTFICKKRRRATCNAQIQILHAKINSARARLRAEYNNTTTGSTVTVKMPVHNIIIDYRSTGTTTAACYCYCRYYTDTDLLSCVLPPPIQLVVGTFLNGIRNEVPSDMQVQYALASINRRSRLVTTTCDA
jgi:hypothetical protein